MTTDALLQWRGRRVLPTELSSFDLREFARDLRMRSVFSARTTNAEYLEEIARVVDDFLSGKTDMATGRWQLLRKLKELGYDPEAGFPGDMGRIPPAMRGSLRDLSSEARLKLVLETNVRVAANYGRMVAGNTPYALHAYPAWEMVRLYQREVPRGSAESHSAGWERRWHDAGEAVAWDGALKSPMIARKDSPIWQALGDGAGGYEDTLNNPFPPFAFNSGMAWQAVERNRCIELGLIEVDESPKAMDGQITPGMQEINNVFAGLSPDLREELDREIAEYNERRMAV